MADTNILPLETAKGLAKGSHEDTQLAARNVLEQIKAGVAEIERLLSLEGLTDGDLADRIQREVIWRTWNCRLDNLQNAARRSTAFSVLLDELKNRGVS